jgi:hypothetical protein
LLVVTTKLDLDSTTENQKARLLHQVVTKWQQGAILFPHKKKKSTYPKRVKIKQMGQFFWGE